MFSTGLQRSLGCAFGKADNKTVSLTQTVALVSLLTPADLERRVASGNLGQPSDGQSQGGHNWEHLRASYPSLPLCVHACLRACVRAWVRAWFAGSLKCLPQVMGGGTRGSECWGPRSRPLWKS